MERRGKVKSSHESFLHHFEECITEKYALKGKAAQELLAPKENIKIRIQCKGQYLLYTFDKDGEELFPFFKNVSDLKIKADYLIIKEHNGKPFAFIIELKKNKGNPSKQIEATKVFVEFLISNIDRIKKSGYKQELTLRGIKYSKLSRDRNRKKGHLLAKYDMLGNYDLRGDTLHLDRFLN
ncbi:MAG: hypothetical protein LBU08_03760 [Tannerellaceae bacterium]|nr:hypothetical protein [Tannerellaceae bacterium]